MSGNPYEVTQQAGSLTAASITGVTAASATTFLTIDKPRTMLSIVSSLNQPMIVLRNGVYWHYLPSSGAAIFDLGSDNQYLGVGVSFQAFAVSATATSGVLYGMAT